MAGCRATLAYEKNDEDEDEDECRKNEDLRK
jgi:hypothetical protein